VVVDDTLQPESADRLGPHLSVDFGTRSLLDKVSQTIAQRLAVTLLLFRILPHTARSEVAFESVAPLPQIFLLVLLSSNLL